MPSRFQHSIAFQGDTFGIFSLFKNQPNAFFLDSSLRRSKAQFSYIGFTPFKTLKNPSLEELKSSFNQQRIKRQDLTFPAGAVGYFGYDGSIFFGFYDTILTIDHQNKKLTISSNTKSSNKEALMLIQN